MVSESKIVTEVEGYINEFLKARDEKELLEAEIMAFMPDFFKRMEECTGEMLSATTQIEHAVREHGSTVTVGDHTFTVKLGSVRKLPSPEFIEQVADRMDLREMLDFNVISNVTIKAGLIPMLPTEMAAIYGKHVVHKQNAPSVKMPKMFKIKE